MFCGKCGASVPDGYEFCMKCGTKLNISEEAIEDTLEVSSDEAKENTSVCVKSNKKKIIILASVVVVVIVGIFFFVTQSIKRNGLYNNVAWGTSIEEVMEIAEKESDDVIDGKDDSKVQYAFEDYNGVKGLTLLVTYQCEGEKGLDSVGLLLLNSEDGEYTDEEILDLAHEKLTKLYGKAEDDGIHDTWNTKLSEISLSYVMDGLIAVKYQNIETANE